MYTTMFQEGTRTLTLEGSPSTRGPEDLIERYESLINGERTNWTEHLRLQRQLGAGGQGVVYLSERRGADNFTLPIAIKVFSPERYADAISYHEAMQRVARVGSVVARIQQDNLLDVHNFIDPNRIRMMVMEWVDGYDLSELLDQKMLDRLHERASARRWEYVNNVIVTAGPLQPRIKPGIAMAIIRDCLAALAALHREQVVHGDVKPSNIMIKRTGDAKIVDIGSAFELHDPPPQRTCTPAYAAPEVLEGAEYTPRSDLASLGYVLIEMLAGRPPFKRTSSLRELLEEKRFLAQRLAQILPEEVVCNSLLMNFCRGLIAPDPMRRYPTAEDADFQKGGAASFHRQLIQGDLASEYDNEIRQWLAGLE